MKPEIEYVYNKLKKLRFDFNSIDFREFRSRYRYEPTLNRYVRKDDNDLFIAKDTFKPLEDELEYADNCHNLEEQIGCPLEVRERAFEKGFYDENGNHYTCEHYVPYLKEMHTRGIMTHTHKRFKLTDYKKTWWLRKDKSE